MARRMDISAPRVLHSEAQRMCDQALLKDFVVTHQPGKIGSPAASAEVQPAGRKAFEFRSKMAPQSAFQLAPPLTGKARPSS